MRAPQDQLFDRTIEFFPARGGHVGLGRLGGQDFLLSPPYAGQTGVLPLESRYTPTPRSTFEEDASARYFAINPKIESAFSCLSC